MRSITQSHSVLSFLTFCVVAALFTSGCACGKSLLSQQLATPAVVFSSDIDDLIGGRGVVTNVAWDADGGRLAIGGSAGLWIYTNELGEIARLEGPTYGITTMAWSSDGNQLAAGGLDDTIWIWDMITYQPLATHGVAARGSLVSLAWSPESDKIASSSFAGPIRVINATTGQLLITLDDPAIETYGYASSIRSLSWHAERDWLAGATCPEGVYVWDTVTGQVIQHLTPTPSCVQAATWSPDGEHIASGGDTMRGRTDSLPGIWDFASGERLISFDGYTEAIYSVTWSPDGSQLATWSSDGLIRIEDASTGHTQGTLQGSTFLGDFASYSGHAIDWSPDGRWLASVGVDGIVRIWDMNTYEVLIAWQGFNGFVPAE
jgi:WD40 repeat protein